MTSEQIKQLEKDLWAAADNLRANTGLKSSEYATPVLGLIFLKFCDIKYRMVEQDITEELEELKGSRREKSISEIAIKKCGFYLPENARYDFLLHLPEQEDLAKKIREAMMEVEKYKTELDGVLPKAEYASFNKTPESRQALIDLVKAFSNIPTDSSGDVLGKIYEFFLGEFALSEGQGGGEFFTPTSVVKVMVEIIEPHSGTVYDPACGSGGMFVQSQHFIEEHRKALADAGKVVNDDSIYVYGQEKTGDTVKLAKMNLAVNGLRGEIRETNSYASDPYDGFGKFDFVMANPPFNVDDVAVATIENDARFNTYGIPRNKTKVGKKDEGKETCPNGNYLWISLFATSLKDKTGRAALVMANSASDARHSEADIRQKLVENNLIYGMLTLPSNMFYTVTLPATLWFFDKGKKNDNILFIDARNIFRQIDRAHREFTEEQIKNIGIISKLHKGDRESFVRLVDSYFEKGVTLFGKYEAPIRTLSHQVKAFLLSNNEKNIPDLEHHLEQFLKLALSHTAYKSAVNLTDPDSANHAQHTLAQTFSPFFIALHEMLKSIDKKVRHYEKEHKNSRELKTLKTDIESLHTTVKDAEIYFSHIAWLQERFPKAEYENVTGLCKLASPAEVAVQEYSLNPGRYVGVVIEEDGKTEEEFLAEMSGLNEELERLSGEARDLESVIAHNMKMIVGDE